MGHGRPLLSASAPTGSVVCYRTTRPNTAGVEERWTAMQPNGLRSVDVSILEYLERHPPEYVPLVANRLGVHLGYAEGRFELLVEEELVRPVTNESIYTITDRGRAVLDAETEGEGSERESVELPAFADD